MKKLILILALLSMLSSCRSKDNVLVKSNIAYSVYVEQIDRHEYIIVRGTYSISIIHKYDCAGCTAWSD